MNEKPLTPKQRVLQRYPDSQYQCYSKNRYHAVFIYSENREINFFLRDSSDAAWEAAWKWVEAQS